MRVQTAAPLLTDHDGLVTLPNQHHPPVETVTIQINGTTIAPGAYTYSTALTYSGHKIVRAILRGPISVDIVGSAGAYVVGTDTADQAAGFSMVPSNIALYPTTYMGGYSRMHGDTYLTEMVFGVMPAAHIVLKDVRINGSNLELVFQNLDGVNRALYCYGLCVVK